MRPITPLIVGLATFAAAALAQTAAAPIEQKSGANAQTADQPAPAGNDANANTASPREPAPASPANGTTPDEPKR